MLERDKDKTGPEKRIKQLEQALARSIDMSESYLQEYKGTPVYDYQMKRISRLKEILNYS